MAGNIKTDLKMRAAELNSEWRRVRTAHPRIVAGLWTAFALVTMLALVFAVKFAAGLGDGLPDRETIQRIGDMEESTAVYDDSDRLAFTIFEEQRIAVPLTSISPNLVHALIAIEDQRFYDHHGFDVIRMASAAMTNLRHARAVQGGSTITQQLARQSFLKPDKTLRRKLQELILAGRIERLYTKPQILELYLNKVYFGDGLYGAEAAARGYFGKHASELNIAEAATLAGLVKSPSTYAPTVSPERAVARRNLVLQAMLESGSIDRAAWQSARATKLALNDTLRSSEPHGEYFKEQLRIELVDRFGWQRVYQGGLRVYSTIDMPMQIAAESAVDDQLKAIESRRAAWVARLAARAARNTAPKPVATVAVKEPLQAALIALEPGTGSVRAMVGGRDFNRSHFNRAVQAHRQPGSAFKPFVYATALEEGYTPATLIDHLDEPIATLQGAWTPEDEHSSATEMTMRTALRTSSNRAAVRMLQEVGIARTVEYAKQMGIGDLPSVPSLALGAGEVTLESMTAAYAAFANHGSVPRPMLIRRVEDQDGRVLFENQEVSTRAISDTTAFLMSTMMADVINAGTGARARKIGFTLPAAGKTGTTNDFNDAWFVGFTPKLVTGVWVGFDQPHTILPNGFAADVAVPMWATFMKAATKNDKPEWLLPPAGVVAVNVCRLSGKLPGEGCDNVEVVSNDGSTDHRSMIYTEYFVRGTEPTTYCDLHPTRGIAGKLADVLGLRTAPPPVRADDPVVVSASAAATPAAPELVDPSIAPPQQEKPKRGFWSRVFGFGRSDNSRDHHDPSDKDRKPEKKKPGG
ncbi:MAG TPA: PBP1A family penicillin-binding protein [Vicinamibacterales bacterium]|nr:PBP1A family penicillin-binding protein [Vicinamibacterales bacterium]